MSPGPGSVVVFHNGYGDYVLALPALRALAASLPRPSLLVVGAGPQQFIVADAGFDECAFVDFTRHGATTEFDWQAIVDRRPGPDVLVALCPWESASLRELHQALRPDRSIGFGRPCTEVIDYGGPGHEADVLFSVVHRLAPSARPEDFSAPPAWPPRTAGVATALRAALPPAGRLLVAHLDSVPDKTWPADRLDAALAEVLGRHPTLYALVLNTATEMLPVASGTGRATGLPGLSLDRAMCVAGAADVFVGIDSCMLHVADLCRRPGVGLFAGTAPERFGFRWTDSRHVRYVRGRTMQDIGPAPVADAILDLLEDDAQSSS